MQPVTQRQQMACVLRRIIEHVGRERAHAPIGALMLLVQLHAEELFEQGSEPERANAQQLRGHARVEEMRDTPPVILVQQAQIVIGVVQHDLDGAILEQGAKARRRADGQGIDHRFMVQRGQLQQIDAIDEAVKTRAFGVERERAHAGQSGEKAINGVSRVEIERGGRQWHVSP